MFCPDFFFMQLASPLLNMFEESFKNNILPPSLRLATTTLILKQIKYRLNAHHPDLLVSWVFDTKILCKVLAKRLDLYFHSLVHNNQIGFVLGRKGFHNIRRVVNIIHSKNKYQGTALLSLDARQAFNRIEWPYLFNLLPRYRLGGKFFKWVKIYTNPTAQILIYQAHLI